MLERDSCWVAGVSGEKQLEAAVGLIHQEIGVLVGAADGFADQPLGTLHLLFHNRVTAPPPEAGSCRPHWPVAASAARPGRAEQRSIASRIRLIGCKGSQGRTFFKALLQQLRRDLSAEAAGVGFAGGEGAVFPEFVAAVAPAAEAEVLAAFVAGVHAAGHISREPTELLGVGGLRQRKILEIAIDLDQGPFLRLDPIKRRELEVLCCGTPCVNSWPF